MITFYEDYFSEGDIQPFRLGLPAVLHFEHNRLTQTQSKTYRCIESAWQNQSSLDYLSVSYGDEIKVEFYVFYVVNEFTCSSVLYFLLSLVILP